MSKSSIFLSALLILQFALAAPGRTEDDISRLAAAVAAAGHHVPPAATLEEACAGDILCVARFLRDRMGAGAALVPDENERGAWTARRRTPLDVIALADGGYRVSVRDIDGAALLAGLPDPAPVRLNLDLRDYTESTRLDRMRRAAAVFVGSIPRAFRVLHLGGNTVDWSVPAAAERRRPGRLDVRVGPDTGTAGILLAHLLKTYAGARITGTGAPGAAYLTRTVAVGQGWSLKIPFARIAVGGGFLDPGSVDDTTGNN